ncbi:hypothetical protein [Paenibacillus periandrae]|uniref:hypothetical protein n=1 Tax=Paenibacillus periandrae TaxID=1761741 RepID=UPI001F0910C2|nr:hypothetical protein [Paenibacillus periandrae]
MKNIPQEQLTITSEATSTSEETDKFLHDFYSRFSRTLYHIIYKHLVMNNMMPFSHDQYREGRFYIDALASIFSSKLDKLYAIRACVSDYINSHIEDTIRDALAETARLMCPERFQLRSSK